MEEHKFKKWNGRILSGLLLLTVGSVLLLQRLGVDFPFWLFKWPVLLIVIGVFLGLRHGFRSPGWVIMIITGSIFLFDMIEPGYSIRQYSLPVIIIALGLIMILRPRGMQRFSSQWGNDQRRPWQESAPPNQIAATDLPDQNMVASKQDFIDSVAIFGGVRKVIVSKNFRGGEVFALLGGHEIDFSQADFEGEVTLDVTQVFGGTKIVIPAHWNITSEMVAIFGGIEDKRQIPPGATNFNKSLILKGTSIFGGIDIRNY